MEVVTEKPAKKSIPEGFKRSEVGIIPEDWEVYKQTEVVEYINGRAYSKDEWESNGVPVVRLQNLTGSGDNYYYSTLNLPEKNYIYNGDLIFMWSASFGPYIWRGPKAIFHYHIWKINCDEDLVDKVFYYFKLLELTKALKKNTSGSTMLHLTKTSMEEYKIALPPTIEEQQAIAEALSDVDVLIAELDALIEKKQQIKKGAMQQLLTGKKRLPGFDGEWEEKTLEEVANVIDPHPSHRAPKAKKKGIPFVGIGDLSTRGEIISTSYRTVDESIYDEHRERYKLENGLIGLGRVASIGKVVRLKSNLGKYTVSPTLAILEPKDIDKNVLYYLLGSKFVRDQFKTIQSGSTRSSVGMRVLRKIKLKLPSLKEQYEISSILKDMDEEIDILLEKREKYEQIKQGMMQELMTGKTRLVKEEKAKTNAQLKPSHNWEFDEAVLISVLADCFGTKEFPLGRFRRTKYSYLVRRYLESKVDQFLKKAAGPYNPKTRYSGPENIALNNGYVQNWKNKKRKGFIADDSIDQAWNYFENWYGQQAIDWLEEGFRYAKNKELELLTTVDKARIELEKGNRDVTLSTVKEVIASHPEWKPKLEREIFSDENIEQAIQESKKLFS